MDLSPLHPTNAPLSIVVIELGMLIDVISLQFENALSPIEVTLYVVPLYVTLLGMDRLSVGIV